jgi:hypothetical protein
MPNDGSHFLDASRTEGFYCQTIESSRVVSYGRRISKGRFVENSRTCLPKINFNCLQGGKF